MKLVFDVLTKNKSPDRQISNCNSDPKADINSEKICNFSENTSQEPAATEPLKEFQSLVRAIRNGSEDAAWQLLDQFGPHILRVIRRKLSREMRVKYDSCDFAQAIWLSFFTHRSQITRFTKPEELVGFLCGITRNKLATEYRRNISILKRNVRREESINRRVEGGPLEIGRDNPTPSEFAMARERWETIVSDLTDRDRAIVRLKYEGRTNPEIAAALSITERTVRRVMEKIGAEAAA